MAYDEDLAERVRELIAGLAPWVALGVELARSEPPEAVKRT
jgi:uncharacterized protein YebE (UPF0316 family)